MYIYNVCTYIIVKMMYPIGKRECFPSTYVRRNFNVDKLSGVVEVDRGDEKGVRRGVERSRLGEENAMYSR